MVTTASNLDENTPNTNTSQQYILRESDLCAVSQKSNVKVENNVNRKGKLIIAFERLISAINYLSLNRNLLNKKLHISMGVFRMSVNEDNEDVANNRSK